MYIPPEFETTDTARIHEFIRAYPFATVITEDSSGGSREPWVSHLPLLLAPTEPPVLRGHIARANPQLAEVERGAAVLAIFHGPHGYVSPSSYARQPSVPTWNYGVVHAHGVLRPMGDGGLGRLLEDSVSAFEGPDDPWKLALPDDYRTAMMSKICGFEIEITRVEAKLKLSQNKSAEDQRRVIERLERGDPSSRELAGLMRRVLAIR